MIIYQTFTLYINISETDFTVYNQFIQLKQLLQRHFSQTESSWKVWDFVKKFLVTTQILTFLSHAVHIHVIEFNTAGFV